MTSYAHKPAFQAAMRKFIDKAHRILGKSRLAALTFAKIRNQASSVIGAYLGETANSYGNGEYAVVDLVAPLCRYFIDVGANRGEWTEYFLRSSSASGSLFEPSLAAFKVLTEKFRASGISIQCLAVGDYVGTALFVEEPNCGETSSIAIVHPPCGIPSREVSMCTLDAAFGNKDLMIDYLKIDAEGYDFKVLLGANALLRQNRIRFIQFEYNSSWIAAGHSLKQCTTYLNDLGYEVFIIRSSGLHPFRYELWGDFFRYSNFFSCMPEDRHKVSRLIGSDI
jgi:FkbM family methyltransferase